MRRPARRLPANLRCAMPWNFIQVPFNSLTTQGHLATLFVAYRDNRLAAGGVLRLNLALSDAFLPQQVGKLSLVYVILIINFLINILDLLFGRPLEFARPWQ